MYHQKYLLGIIIMVKILSMDKLSLDIISPVVNIIVTRHDCSVIVI